MATYESTIASVDWGFTGFKVAELRPFVTDRNQPIAVIDDSDMKDWIAALCESEYTRRSMGIAFFRAYPPESPGGRILPRWSQRQI